MRIKEPKPPRPILPVCVSFVGDDTLTEPIAPTLKKTGLKWISSTRTEEGPWVPVPHVILWTLVREAKNLKFFKKICVKKLSVKTKLSGGGIGFIRCLFVWSLHPGTPHR